MGDQCSKTAKGSSGPLPPPPPPPLRRRTTPPSASASAADASTSCGLRQQGNAKYASAFHGASANTRSQSRAPVLRIGDAKEALRLYQLATNLADDANEWSSAQKNLGMAALRLSEMVQYQERASPEEVQAQFHVSLLSLTAAFINGHKASKNRQWHEELEGHIHGAVSGLVAYVIDAHASHSKRFAVVRKTATALPQDSIGAALAWYACANEFFKHSVRLDECGNWQGAMNCLHEMNEPLERMRLSLQSLDDAYALAEAMVELNKSRTALLAKAESTQHLFVAQNAQQGLLFEQEDLNMDLLWFVMDSYKAATRPAADEEAEEQADDNGSLETEAIALSAQGVLYQKVLKVPNVAKLLFESAIRIAMAITQTTGSNYHAQKWYQDAVEGLETIRQEQIAFDLKQVQEQREPTLEKLKPQLDALTSAIMKNEARRPRALNLLKHIYATHPPKVEGAELQAGLEYDDNAKMKKALLKAATHYHPDKPINKSSGIEWFVLCEEITKHINDYHGHYKGL